MRQPGRRSERDGNLAGKPAITASAGGDRRLFFVPVSCRSAAHERSPAARPPRPDEQMEHAVVEAFTRLRKRSETALQALRLIHAGTPAPARGALLAVETLLAESLGLNVAFCHLRGEHDRARAALEIEKAMQRGVSEALQRPAAVAERSGRVARRRKKLPGTGCGECPGRSFRVHIRRPATLSPPQTRGCSNDCSGTANLRGRRGGDK